MIEIVRITTPEVPIEKSAWTLHRAETFDDAAKVMRERFVHAVVIDDSLASDFIKRLYGYYQYPFPRERLFRSVRRIAHGASQPAWVLYSNSHGRPASRRTSVRTPRSPHPRSSTSSSAIRHGSTSSG